MGLFSSIGNAISSITKPVSFPLCFIFMYQYITVSVVRKPFHTF